LAEGSEDFCALLVGGVEVELAAELFWKSFLARNESMSSSVRFWNSLRLTELSSCEPIGLHLHLQICLSDDKAFDDVRMKGVALERE